MQQQHLDYWLDALRGAPVGQPIFRQEASTHPAVPAPADVNGGWLEFEVDPAVAEGLYQLARRNNASLFNVVYAGITSALRLLGGPADLLVGTSTSGRNDAEFFDTVGYFTTVVVHRVRFDEGLTVAGLVSQVKTPSTARCRTPIFRSIWWRKGCSAWTPTARTTCLKCLSRSTAASS